MRRRRALVRAGLIIAGALMGHPTRLALADVNRDALVRLDLTGSPILRGFRPAGSPNHASAAETDADGSALAVRRQRLFHGPTEVRVTVMLFASADARDGWIARSKRLYQRGLGFRNVSAGEHVRPHAWMTRATERGLDSARRRLGPSAAMDAVWRAAEKQTMAMGAEAMVNRALLMLEGHQHPEMVRRGQAGADGALTDAALARRLGQAGDELVKRARALPLNKP
ncbi:MAG: hypothetical protein NT029_07750 [Armatimonadetes bacterium]|nr:hypothetical protein [Armatimonadota bacterium]